MSDFERENEAQERATESSATSITAESVGIDLATRQPELRSMSSSKQNDSLPSLQLTDNAEKSQSNQAYESTALAGQDKPPKAVADKFSHDLTDGMADGFISKPGSDPVKEYRQEKMKELAKDLEKMSPEDQQKTIDQINKNFKESPYLKARNMSMELSLKDGILTLAIRNGRR